MRVAITAVLTYQMEVFFITRQNHLTAFPGYTAFPGGTVEKSDHCEHPKLSQFSPSLAGALVRELKEELDFDLIESLNSDQVISLTPLDVAVTPSFNPYRFETHFVHIELSQRLTFKCDEHEIFEGAWRDPKNVLKEYFQNDIVCVPPTLRVIEAFASPVRPVQVDFSRDHDLHSEVPFIEVLSGVIQLLPLSNTFPPANRTNAFIIGDQKRVLIDPSPKDETEYQKLVKTLKRFEVDEIFLTHHHPDHHEFSPRLARELSLSISMSVKTEELILERWGKDYFKGLDLIYKAEGDRLTRMRDVDVILYSVPGHDEGQLAPAVADLKWIIVGDLIQSVGTVVIGAPEGDMAKYFESLNKMIQLKPKFIIPSHGITLGGTDKLELTLKHREHRELQIIELLKQGQNQEQILEHIYQGLEAGLVKYARKTIEAHIKKIMDQKLI
ncbi:MAG: hypothetical protein COW00_09760 [Bdellovibrio sp. CG12_big_fil_rev_8_21_14_0_65_39_13]|nr:MAG: hypothetical protein COW78_15935 [Bdellovibrio sp. CG22_combo_CG10-13_8_21_14_all_39_27]PIQ59585.1 MAG: hypothetical protein COW00_09760 [Bdellovibrio sp. CG12_big_fil_rev_8_21_14_0_65_39_13]PIR33179.1 MAG: hypothetical protein COV37_17185 [Bdellovibrio sp. CG11_big_fil_rev_8_21_14_0_20_39_38]